MRWSQTGQTLCLTTSVGSVHAKMPRGWKLERVHPAVLAMAEWMLGHRLLASEVPSMRQVLKMEPREPGTGHLLSFSGGADSLTAFRITDATPVYLRRPYDSYVLRGNMIRMGSTRAVDELVERVGAIVIDNTVEQLGLMAGGRHGFQYGYGYGALLALLADHLDAGAISFGTILEVMWFGTGDGAAAGSQFVDIVSTPSSKWKMARAIFRVAGLELNLPVGGCSEVVTTRVGHGGVSCPTPADDGTPCGVCFKCFRKEQILGHRIPVQRTVRRKLAHRPLKVAPSVLHACRCAGYYPPEVEEFADLDTGWTERHFDASLDALCSPKIAAKARRRLAAYGIKPMSGEDVEAMQGFMR